MFRRAEIRQPIAIVMDTLVHTLAVGMLTSNRTRLPTDCVRVSIKEETQREKQIKTASVTVSCSGWGFRKEDLEKVFSESALELQEGLGLIIAYSASRRETVCSIATTTKDDQFIFSGDSKTRRVTMGIKEGEWCGTQVSTFVYVSVSVHMTTVYGFCFMVLFER